LQEIRLSCTLPKAMPVNYQPVVDDETSITTTSSSRV